MVLHFPHRLRMVVIATRAPASATVVVCSTSFNQIVLAALSLTFRLVRVPHPSRPLCEGWGIFSCLVTFLGCGFQLNDKGRCHSQRTSENHDRNLRLYSR